MMKSDGERSLQLGQRTLVMGILNITPDSFSDGGKYIDVADAVEQARTLIRQGADILDIGGESTRPGADPVSLEEELKRVIPVITTIRESGITVPISIDTYKAEVAKQALEAGADIVNDIWGLQKDPDMARIIATHRCPVVIMHNRERPEYRNFLVEVIEDLQASIAIAHRAGIADECIILDPGIGFAKDMTQNLLLMNHLHRIVQLGYPVLLGTSRKSMIHRTLQLPADHVIEGTAATVALGIAQGCQIIRVHDVEQMIKAIRITDAIVAAQRTEREGEKTDG